MTDLLTIPKNRPVPTIANFQWLQGKALQYIEDLSNKLWTDYNAHDPGINISDVLAWAFSEAGYKLNFTTHDLFARLPGDTKKDFYTAKEILTNNPTTILDLRKFVIDQPGLQNAWFYKHFYPLTDPLPTVCNDEFYTDTIENETFICAPAFYYKCQAGSKAYDVKFTNPLDYVAKRLNGLYDVVLQLEENEEFGDLNANVIEWTIKNGPDDFKLKIVFPVIQVQFPAWDFPIAEILNFTNLTSTVITAVTGTGNIRNIDMITFTFDSDPTKQIVFTNLKVIIETVGVLSNTVIKNRLEQMPANQPSFGVWVMKRLKTILTLIRQVHCALHTVRNLCEDYVKYRIVRQQEILLCADIEVEPSADLEEILAEIYFRIDSFLAPPVRFYNLLEIYQKGKRTEEIFEGYVLNHGFIIDEELVNSDLKTEVHTSDLYHIIMDIPGVKTVKHLQITNYLDGVPQTPGELWCLKLNGAYSLNLSKDSNNKIHFYRNGLLFFADAEQAELLIKTLQAENSKPKLPNTENDLPVPFGTYRHLKDYSSIQNDFPEIYKTGKNGIAHSDSITRIAQVKQLKAFLLFFDQVLINLFGQFELAKDLLSVDNSISIPATYASLPVYDLMAGSGLPNFHHIPNLIKDFTNLLPSGTNLDDEQSYQLQWDAFAAYENNSFMTHLREITEDKVTYYKRRHLFLDHLLARFAENFSEYSIISYKMFPPVTDEDLFDSFNIIDLGGNLFDFEYYIGVLKVLENNPPSITGLDACKSIIRRVIINGMDFDNYIIDPSNNFRFVLQDENATVLARNNNPFVDQVSAETVIFNIIQALSALYYQEEVELLEDKQLFLGDYPRLSSQRGKGFKYKCCTNGGLPKWPAENISGLQRRVSRLLGINDPTDRLLLPFERDFIVSAVTATTSKFIFQEWGVGPILLESQSPHFNNSDYPQALFNVIKAGVLRDRYFLVGNSFELHDESGNILAIPTPVFSSAPERDSFINNLIDYFKAEYYQEGFHLVEHILLRPIMEGLISATDIDEGYFGLCQLDDGCDCPITDQYSFRITIALPYWPERFQNMNYRAYAERVIRFETPAHILPKICWIDFADMFELETLYLEWVALECQAKPDRTDLHNAISALIKKINNLTNVYPEGVLHDCENPTDEEAIVLNQSALGTND